MSLILVSPSGHKRQRLEGEDPYSTDSLATSIALSLSAPSSSSSSGSSADSSVSLSSTTPTLSATRPLFSALSSRQVAFRGKKISGRVLPKHPKAQRKKISSDPQENEKIGSRLKSQGKHIFPDGTVYEGDIVDGVLTGRGKYTLAEGVYEGEVVDSQATGLGKFTFVNGDVYEGNFVSGQRTGRGKYTFADGESHEGNFINGRLTHGKITFVNGDLYEGNVVGNQMSGRGRVTFVDGRVYEGDFVDGKRTGKAKLTYSDGTIYEGDVINGLLTGQGKFSYLDGSVYEGDVVDSRVTGRGKIIFPDRNIYEGDVVDGRMTGQGKYIFAYGGVYEGFFNDDYPLVDASNIGDSCFLQLLAGFFTPMVPQYSMDIMSDYLIKNGYKELGSALKSAADIFKTPNDQIIDSRKSLHLKLNQQNISQLLCFNAKGHSMGLNIVPDASSDSVILEIYNSGSGLNFHERNGHKFQTMLKTKFTKRELSEKKIEQFLNVFESIESAYQELGVPERIIKAEPKSAVWQTLQKSGNCTLEWIFAFLRNKMPKEEYDRMRMKLFLDCLEKIKDKGSEFDEIRKELNRKIEKRKLRLQKKCPVSSGGDGDRGRRGAHCRGD